MSAEINKSTGENGGQAAGSDFDVTDRRAVTAWFESIGDIDIAVANVSALSGDWDAAIATDLRGTVNVIEEAANKVVDGGASPTSAQAGSIATPRFEAYGAIKAAMAHYAKSTAEKLVSRNVRVNVVSPGDTFIEGGFWDSIRKFASDVYDAAVAGNPLGRLARPDQIARVVTFISSPAASFVSGANWHGDGGTTSYIQL